MLTSNLAGSARLRKIPHLKSASCFGLGFKALPSDNGRALTEILVREEVILGILSNPVRVLSAIEAIPGLREEPFTLVDVGCSGGIDSKWRELKNPLRVYGFDPLEGEISRLTRHAKDGECYEAAFIVGPNPPKEGEGTLASFPLSSAAQVQEQMAQSGNSYRQEKFNSGLPVEESNKKFTLDHYFTNVEKETPNFIKVDTDGFDFQVLQGASRILTRPECIGVQIESQFHGNPFDGDSNTFSNIDRFLRQHGFSLYRIEPWSYSRRALPAPFVYDIPAQTESGPVDWAEALYFKDPWLRHPAAFDDPFSGRLPVPLILALALHGFPDVVAQIISEARRRGDASVSADVLDRLVAGNSVGAATYEQYLQIFRQKPEAWFPSSLRGMVPGARVGGIQYRAIRLLRRLRGILPRL